MIELTHRQARALAAFLTSLRPEWSHASIMDALHRARALATAADLALAAIRAASIDTNRTPGVIPLAGPHWRAAEAPPRHRFDPAEVCATCSERRETCRSLWSGDHEFVAVERRRAITSTPAPADLRESTRDAARPKPASGGAR